MGERNYAETGIVRPDDIVERLLQRCVGGGMTRQVMRDAADEIERLRALANDLHHDATCTESFCRLCGEGVREWEARRE